MGACSASCDLCRGVDIERYQCIVAVSMPCLAATFRYQISMTEKTEELPTTCTPYAGPFPG